jgi:hypothetical protein
MRQLNQSSALICGKFSGSWCASTSVIQAALPIPPSTDPVSVIAIGFVGASWSRLA